MKDRTTPSQQSRLPQESAGILVLLLLVVLVFLLLGSDAWPALRWWLVLLVPGLLFMPLSTHLFSGMQDKGYLFARVIGLLLPAYVMWLLSSFRLLRFSLPAMLAILLVMAGLIWSLTRGGKRLRSILGDSRLRSGWLWREAVFLAAFIGWAFLRGLKPEIAGEGGLEKFMDYGFMNTLLRTDYMPPLDMWFAGKPINYYYFGHYLASWLTRLAGVSSGVGYNLMMATLFAMTFGFVFSLGSHLGRQIAGIKPRTVLLAGLLSAMLVSLGGNLHPLVHTFVFQPYKEALQRVEPNLEVRDSYWFPDATRFIGHNPATLPPTEDKTIHEFPFYSFVVSDLHAHVINLPLVLTSLALMLSMVAKRHGMGGKVAIAERILPLSFLLGVFQMTNFWDFPIYATVAAAFLFYSQVRTMGASTDGSFRFPRVLSSGSEANGGFDWRFPRNMKSLSTQGMACIGVAILAGAAGLLLGYPAHLVLLVGIVTWVVVNLLFAGVRVLLPVGLDLLLLITLSMMIAWPFSSQLQSLVNGIARVPLYSAFWQLIVVWGFPILMIALFLVLFLVGEERLLGKSQTPRLSVRSSVRTATASRSPHVLLADKLLLQPGDAMVAILFLCGVGLVMLPEILYIKDIYTSGYVRSNTMFKLTYQAFVLFSLGAGYVAARLLSIPLKTMKLGYMRVAMWIGMAGVMIYPLYAIPSWYGELRISRYQGQDGRVYLQTRHPDDAAAAAWLNAHVQGQPVVLEAHGLSYTDTGRISVETGLPTVLGWRTHEHLWRNDVTVVDERAAHIQTIMESGILSLATWKGNNIPTFWRRNSCLLVKWCFKAAQPCLLRLRGNSLCLKITGLPPYLSTNPIEWVCMFARMERR